MINIAEICNEFSTFLLALEVGPWKDDGSGTVIESLLEGGSTNDSAVCKLSNIQENDEACRVAQLKANEIGCKVVLSISGNHKQVGLKRVELGVFYPQIKTEFRTPKAVHLEVKVQCNGRIDVTGDNLDTAKETLIKWVLWAAKTSYGWEGGGRTRGLIPEPPEGHSLFVVLVQPSRDRPWEVQEEYFVAVHDSKRPIFRSTISRIGEFVCLEDDADNAKLPAGSYIHNGESWQVIKSHCWWALNS